MKVNITGRGIIPGIGVIPPVYKREMSEKAVLRLLNFPSFKVYDASSGVLITKNNIKEIGSVKPTITNTQPPINDTEEKKTETQKVDNTPEPVAMDFVDDVHDVSGLITDDPIMDINEPKHVVEETVETTESDDEQKEVTEDVESLSEKPENGSHNNKHNNNKNKNRNKNRH